MGWFCCVVELWLCNLRQNSCEALINLCSGLPSRRPAPPRQRATNSDIAEHGNCFCWPHPNKQLVDRFTRFASGDWINLLIATRKQQKRLQSLRVVDVASKTNEGQSEHKRWWQWVRHHRAGQHGKVNQSPLGIKPHWIL